MEATHDAISWSSTPHPRATPPTTPLRRSGAGVGGAPRAFFRALSGVLFSAKGREQETLEEWYQDELRKLDPLLDPQGAFLWPQVQISRQYSLHLLKLPGDVQPTWHKYLGEALTRADELGFNELTIVMPQAHYRLRKVLEGE